MYNSLLLSRRIFRALNSAGGYAPHFRQRVRSSKVALRTNPKARVDAEVNTEKCNANHCGHGVLLCFNVTNIKNKATVILLR